MAEAKSGEGNTAMPSPENGAHDRVTMLSLRADGIPDQTAPEIIGPREFAEAATRQQFREQAVSAVDERERGVTSGGDVEQLEQDPTIAALKEKHEAAEEAAFSAADATVERLYTEDEALQTAPGTDGTPDVTEKTAETRTARSSRSSTSTDKK